MMYFYYYLILFLIVIQFITERYLSFLNRRYWSDRLPHELAAFYDEEKYRLSQQYEKEKDRFEWITSGLSILFILFILVTSTFGAISDAVENYVKGPYLTALLFFGILGIVSDIVSTPFQLYETFVIEEKFGFNKTSLKTFIFDKIKGWVLALILGGGILILIIWIYSWSGMYFCLLAWGFMALFSVLMNMFYSNLIVPLFNRQSPLEDGSLRQSILEYTDKQGFKINNIFVLDGSKRSTKANAYFSGLGPKKRIILFDTLIREHTVEEIVAVIAHEIGHYKKKHTIRNMFLSLTESAIFLLLLSLLLNNETLAGALGASKASFHLNLLGFVLLYSPVSFGLGLLNHYLSRKYEYEADKFASETFSGEALGNALIKISVSHLSNLRPHPVYVFCYYSHPTLLQRLRAINQSQ